ncbi:hypothetical protein [Lacrimispora sp.]|uniref:hypothetical protein n=1 Tax=Lacrimispora sp. TaxID=2719234 RepID=UPI0039965678
MKLLVLKIQEPDYGCEERPADYIMMDRVVLCGDDHEEIVMEISDAKLYEKDINEGDWVYFDVNNVIYKE